jgi:hypothetical protein
MEIVMNGDMTVVVPFGQFDPTPVLTNGMVSMHADLDGARELILSCINGEDIGAFSVIGPNPNKLVQPAGPEDMLWGSKVASMMHTSNTDHSVTFIVNAWRKATLRTFAYKAEMAMAVFDADPGPPRGVVLASDMVLRIEMFNQAPDRDAMIIEEPKLAGQPIFTPVVHPDRDFAIAIPEYDNFVTILPVDIRCTLFHRVAGTA